MAGECVITVCGNLVDEVELRFVPNGAAVAKFRVASTPRKFNRDANAWEDDRDGSLFLTCSVWRQQAENAASTLEKGMRVIVVGRLKSRSYEDREGVKRTVFELDVDEVAPSLRNATAQVTKAGGSGQGREQYQQARARSSQEARQDPWAANVPGTVPASGGWDEAPF
jgi:single-strand DNA-binding protein